MIQLSTFFLFLVPLGSIPELPSQSCAEIKASEGEKAFSGKYWLDSIIPGKVVLAHCDMETEGKLRFETCKCDVGH